MPDRLRWAAQSGWFGITDLGCLHGDGVTVDVLDRTPLATILARPGQEAALTDRMRDVLGCEPAAAGRAVVGPNGTLVWSAPGQWLAVGLPAAIHAGLGEALAEVAAVTDQTDSRAIVAIGGPSSRDILAKGFAIDLHPTAFRAGSTAMTKVAYLSVQIWQTDEAPSYRIAVPRSSAGTFWSWLTGACGELRAG